MPKDPTPEDEKRIRLTEAQQDEPEPTPLPPLPPGSEGLSAPKTTHSPGEGVTEEQAAAAEGDDG